MRSIQQFIKQAFFLFALGLITMAITSVLIYGMHIYRTNQSNLEGLGDKINTQITSSQRNARNNMLMAEAIMRKEIENKKIDQIGSGTLMAAAINYNASQFDIWMALSPEMARSMEGNPSGLVFLVSRKPENYNFKTLIKPFSISDYNITLFKHDVYYKNPEEIWYNQTIQNDGKLTYIGAYYDKTYTQRWLFSVAKAVYDENKKLLGVVGIDFGTSLVEKVFREFSTLLGIMVVERSDGRILMDLRSEDHSLIAPNLVYKAKVNDHFIPLEGLETLAKNGKMAHRNHNGTFMVFKVFKSELLPWYMIIYQSAWAFYKGILPLFFALLTVILVFLLALLYFLRENRKKFLHPVQELLSWLKRDTLIIGSNKSISGHYVESDVLEVNELIQSINILFEVVNENFQNYRQELEKNTKIKEELEVLVQKRSEQLIEREKLAALGFMSAGLAHEIKNPLNLICNAAEIIVMQLNKIAQAELHMDEQSARAISRLSESNQIILNNGQRVDNIIKTLLLQVRSSKEGHQHLVDMSELVKTNLDFVLANYRPKMNNRIKVELDKPDNKIIVRGNPVDLGRVFINILDNSCYAMIKKINADSHFMAHLKISLNPMDGGLEIRIYDNGTGIPKVHLSQVFTPFYTTKPPGEGTGLGLNFAYEIVKQHGGTLEVQSTEGEYTEIIMFIPFRGKL
ncbi:ATP-binding protein [Peredibacter sp. HCB2-198]|uniref:ATP-binding protein n=1 Tax=Peredibacter sp. HCB2-198 TaxID=3383025 RepID=UPI0038B65C8F